MNKLIISLILIILILGGSLSYILFKSYTTYTYEKGKVDGAKIVSDYIISQINSQGYLVITDGQGNKVVLVPYIESESQ